MNKKVCNKQITTDDGKTYVTMQSGKRVKLHRCMLYDGHLSKCGWIGYD